MWASIIPVISLLSAIQGEVCYDCLGCFTDKAPWSYTLQRPISRLPWSPEKINTQFLLYTRDNNNTFQKVSAIHPETISASHFQTHRKTHFIIHGFLDNGEKSWMSDMCKAMLQVEDVNCVCVCWRGGSQTSYTQASNNIRVVGAEVAYFIDTLKDGFNYSLADMHIIGHSLGAHVAGEAGKRLPGVFRITGLDPVHPYFQDTPAEVRLDPSDALFVDVIHTDGTPNILNLGMGGYGMSGPVGHLDFYPNGGEHQAGCQKTEILKHGSIDDIINVTDNLVACNHLRSYKYYTESILTPDGFIGYPARTYSAFQDGEGFPCPSGGCPLMGHYADLYRGVTATHQSFYLNTGDDKIYARWRYRISVHTVGTMKGLGSIDISLQGTNGKTSNHRITTGFLQSDRTYIGFMDSEIYVGNINQVTFVWRSALPNIFNKKLGASAVTVQYGKDGRTYSFCNSATVADHTSQILGLCYPV